MESIQQTLVDRDVGRRVWRCGVLAELLLLLSTSSPDIRLQFDQPLWWCETLIEVVKHQVAHGQCLCDSDGIVERVVDRAESDGTVAVVQIVWESKRARRRAAATRQSERRTTQGDSGSEE